MSQLQLEYKRNEQVSKASTSLAKRQSDCHLALLHSRTKSLGSCALACDRREFETMKVNMMRTSITLHSHRPNDMAIDFGVHVSALQALVGEFGQNRGKRRLSRAKHRNKMPRMVILQQHPCLAKISL